MDGIHLKHLACRMAAMTVATSALTVTGAWTGPTLMGAQAATSHSSRGMSARPMAGRSVSLEQWPGQRVVLALPVSLGPNWNADQALGRALLDDAQTRVETALRGTNKLSVIPLHRFEPILVRAVQDKKLTQTELNDATNPLSTVPWLDRARLVLTKLTTDSSFFEQAPLIGDFSIEELRSSGDARRQSVQVQVSGRFYELGAASPKTMIATSDSVRVTRDPYDAILQATRDAFMRVAADFTKPINAYNLPLGNAMPGMSGQNPPAVLVPSMSLPGGARPMPPTLPDGSPLPGDVPIAGSSTRSSPGAVPGPGPQAITIGPPNTTTLPANPAPTAPALPGPNPQPPTNPGPDAAAVGSPNTTTLPTTPAPTAPALPGPNAPAAPVPAK